MNNQKVLEVIAALRIQLNLLEAHITEGKPTTVGDPEVLNMTFEEFCNKLGGRKLQSSIFEENMPRFYEFYGFPDGPYKMLGQIPMWCFVEYCGKNTFLKIRGAGKDSLQRISKKLAESDIVWPK